MKKTPKNAVVVYQSKGGGIDLKGDFKKKPYGQLKLKSLKFLT